MTFNQTEQCFDSSTKPQCFYFSGKSANYWLTFICLCIFNWDSGLYFEIQKKLHASALNVQLKAYCLYACGSSSPLPSHEDKSVCTSICTQACMHTRLFKPVNTLIVWLIETCCNAHCQNALYSRSILVKQMYPCSITSAALHKQSKPTPDLFSQCGETLISTRLMWHVHPQDNIGHHQRESRTEVRNERLLIEALRLLFISG